MLKAKRAALINEDGINNSIFLIRSRPKKKGFGATIPNYNKNSIFGMAIESVSRMSEQKKLRMYLTPTNNAVKERAVTKKTYFRTNYEKPDVPLKIDAFLTDFSSQTSQTIANASSEENTVLSNENTTDSITDSMTDSQKQITKAEVEIQPLFEGETHIPARIKSVDEVIGIAATNISRDIGANCIISIQRKRNQENHNSPEEDKFIDVEVVIFKRSRSNNYKKIVYETRMRKLLQGSVVPIKELLMEAIKKEYIKKGDKVVCVEDESIGMGYKGLLFIFDVDNIFFNISMHHLTDHINSEVLEAVINIALEISKEGFEGKSIGTAFIIGEREEMLRHSKQMIINPFIGCAEENRRITDPVLKETIKNFAQLDGVFLIDKEGVVLSAGAYLNVDVDKEICDALPGFGTRHRCCAALTRMIDAIAIVISQSGGKIRIFKNGKIIMKI